LKPKIHYSSSDMNNCDDGNNVGNGKHIELLSTRRLQPTELHERHDATLCNKTNTCLKLQNTNFDQINHTVDTGRRDLSADSIITKNTINGKTSHSQNRRSHKAFDSAPFYTKVKPHVTIQKRVRYSHISDPSNSRVMPPDRLDGPLVYQKKVEDVHTEIGKKKAPISLNPIFDSSRNEEI